MNDDIKQALSTTPLLRGLGATEIERLATLAVPHDLERRQTLFIEGDRIVGFYLVLSGLVKIYKISADGKEQVLHFAEPGQTFAEASLFGFEGYPASAEAVEPSSVLLIPREQFVSILANDPGLCHRMFRELSIWLRRLSDIIYSLAFRDIEKRLVAYVLKRCEDEQGELRDGIEYDLGIEKALLASYLGTVPETFSRALKKLQVHNLIDVRGSRIALLDIAGLKAILDDE